MSDKRAPVFIWGCWKLIRMLFWLTCCPPIHFDPNTFDRELTQQVIQGRPSGDSISIAYITKKRSSYILICVMNEYISQNIFWLHIPNIANHLYICHPKQFSPFFNLHSSTLGQPDAFSYVVEHKTCDILAAERLRLMRFDNRLIIDSFQEAVCLLKW